MRYRKVFCIFILTIISFIFIREPLLFDHNLQILGEANIPPYNNQVLSHGLSRLFIWNENELGYSMIYPTGLFTRLLIWMLAFFGLNGGSIYNIVIFFSLLLSGLGIFLIIDGITNSKREFPGLFGAIFYMSTPFFFYHTLVGHQNTLVSYGIAPWTILYYLKFLNSKQPQYIMLSGVLLGLAAQMINFLPMLFLILIALTLFVKSNLKIKVVSLLIVSLEAFLINSFWILPNILMPQRGMDFLKFGQRPSGGLIRLSPSPSEAFLGIGFPFSLFRIGVERLFGFWILATIPIVVTGFYSLFIRNDLDSYHNNGMMGFQFLAIISLGWLFAFKSPFLRVISTIYLRIPFMTFFRNITHMHFIYALSLSVLIGFSINTIYGRFFR